MRGNIIFDFYPRPPRGGRRNPSEVKELLAKISIHVLREEDDRIPDVKAAFHSIFLSTSSARRTTNRAINRCLQRQFLSTSSARRTTANMID